MADIIIKPSDWNIQAAKYGIKPGDRLILQGDRAEIEFHDVKDVTVIGDVSKGTKIKGINPGGRVVTFYRSQGIHFTGADGPIDISGGGQGIDFRDRSSDIEFDSVYLHDIGYSGFNCKTDPTCNPNTQRGGFLMKNISVKRCIFERIKTGEAIYVGESHYVSGVKATCDGKTVILMEHEVQNVEVSDNTFLDIGRDAIQMGAVTKGGIVLRNSIKNFGMTKEYGQGSGITLNPGTVAEVAYNTIDTGSGFGILAQGPGGSSIHHNLIKNTGWTGDGGGIMLAIYGTPVGRYKLYNNTLVDINRYGLEYFTDQADVSKNVISMKSGTARKASSSKAPTFLENIELVGVTDQLKLDSSGIPTDTSTVPAGVGWKDYVKPSPVVTKERSPAFIEEVTIDGKVEYFLVNESGFRKKIE